MVQEPCHPDPARGVPGGWGQANPSSGGTSSAGTSMVAFRVMSP